VYKFKCCFFQTPNPDVLTRGFDVMISVLTSSVVDRGFDVMISVLTSSVVDRGFDVIGYSGFFHH
jgi:hypothetical protein